MDHEKEARDKAIKQRVREAISSKGLKVVQFARESGMAYPSLRDYYTGLRKPGFEALAAIVSFSGVSADWLLTGKGPMFSDDDPRMTNINEDLISLVAREVEREYLTSPDLWDEATAADMDSEDYEYSLQNRETQERLHSVQERALIIANVYNRVAMINDENKRESAIGKETKAMLRFHRNMSKTMLGDEPG